MVLILREAVFTTSSVDRFSYFSYSLARELGPFINNMFFCCIRRGSFIESLELIGHQGIVAHLHIEWKV